MEGKRRHVGTKINEKLIQIARSDFFDKSCSRYSGGLILEVPGVEIGSKNQTKNYQNMKSTWEGILASTFDGFWWILDGKLGRKIEPKGIKNGIAKTMKK